MRTFKDWFGRHVVLLFGLGVLLYMFLPIFVVVLMSFNKPKSRLGYNFSGFTTHNWTHLCDPYQLCSSVSVSLRIGLLATLLATILGTLMAFAMVRHHFRGRAASNLMIFLPMASPEIVLGSSLLALFVNGGFAGQLLLVPATQVTPVDIEGTEQMKFIVSGGVAGAHDEA